MASRIRSRPNGKSWRSGGGEGFQAILDTLATLQTEWAQNASQMFSAKGIAEIIQLWAMGVKPAGTGNPTIDVTLQSRPILVNPQDYCTIMPTGYQQMEVELLETRCDLYIHTLPAARFEARISVGSVPFRQDQYLNAGGRELCTVTLAVDEAVWDEYNPLFVAITGSFRMA